MTQTTSNDYGERMYRVRLLPQRGDLPLSCSSVVWQGQPGGGPLPGEARPFDHFTQYPRVEAPRRFYLATPRPAPLPPPSGPGAGRRRRDRC